MQHGETPFLWGAATSSHQVEGYNDKNDWAAWEAKGRIEGGVRCGASTDHWNRFREDLALAAEYGMNSYRFSVEWSRIEPEEGVWDEGALAWYRELVLECERRGLMPMLTLHHFTSPAWFAAKGGFTWEQAPERFLAFVERVFAALGGRIPLWCTINEPMVLAIGTYIGGFMPPAEYSPRLASVACRNLLRAHVLAYDFIKAQNVKREGPWKDVPVLVGLAHNMLDFMPDRRWHPIDLLLSRIFWRFYNRSWLDAITGGKQHFGVLGLMPYADPVPEARRRLTTDYIGVNYYTKAYIHWRPRDAQEERPAQLPIGVTFARRKETISDLSWAVHPEGLRKILRYVAGYGLPIYITENGMADREDTRRPEYLFVHLREIARAVKEGIPVLGFYYWSLLDNFEWVKGFWPRFGLFRVNYDTFERIPTASAALFRKIIRAHVHQNGAPPDPNYFAKGMP